jgi:hypothetical protein
MSELPSQVHLAGAVVRVRNLQRQRCEWCGALLEELDLANVGVVVEAGADGPPLPPSGWPQGALVRVTGTFPRVGTVVEPEPHPEDPDAVAIPEDSCMAVDPWATQ